MRRRVQAHDDDKDLAYIEQQRRQRCRGPQYPGGPDNYKFVPARCVRNRVGKGTRSPEKVVDVKQHTTIVRVFEEELDALRQAAKQYEAVRDKQIEREWEPFLVFTLQMTYHMTKRFEAFISAKLKSKSRPSRETYASKKLESDARKSFFALKPSEAAARSYDRDLTYRAELLLVVVDRLLGFARSFQNIASAAALTTRYTLFSE